MKPNSHSIKTGNEVVARIAYKTNEVCAIYPITPASEMSELVEEWSANNQPNIFGIVPTVLEMQSEAGVAGTMHGALQTGSLSTTFTASQGLLLMIPNMYKIAGELTSNVIHVATRSIASHALSVFGDHSDIMAARQTGYAFLGSASVQEAQDFALISQAATLHSHIPFVHFFDGFRTSHETSKIELIPDSVIQFMMDSKNIDTHRKRSLNPNNPIIRGTAQGSDVFFQSKEATNLFYKACPEIVQKKMNAFATLTGRQYNLFDYVGHPKAEQIIISMASSTETIEKTIQYLNSKGEKIGLIKVRLFRPFSTKHLIEAIPSTCKAIAVLDRTKEAGSTGEPLYLDVLQSLVSTIDTNHFNAFPKVVGGRYGLSSKAFTPDMVNGIIKNLKQEFPKNNFTIGINDDVTNLSLDYSESIQLENTAYEAIFYQEKYRNASESFTNTLQLIGSQGNTFVQGYTECDYRKSNSRNVSHLRIDAQPIKAPYIIKNANFIACQNEFFFNNDNAINSLKLNGTLLVTSSRTSQSFWQSISTDKQEKIIKNNTQLFIVNGEGLKENYTINSHVISSFHACFLALKTDLIYTDEIVDLREHILKIETTANNLSEVIEKSDNNFAESLLGKLLAGKGNEIPVSLLPVDGTFASDTSANNNPKNEDFLPNWHPDLCTQCGACSMACPQGAIRIKAFDKAYSVEATSDFKSIKSLETDWEIDLLDYTIQTHPEQCTSCNICIDACPAKALTMVEKSSVYDSEKENWKYFETIPEFDRTKIDVTKISQQQLQEPLFKYALGEDGCGEAPYLKLMSQLFGDRMLVANATGASSIFGGALPTTPWSKNIDGQGPAWSNSLFEDNAEFGLGYRLSLDQQKQQAKTLLVKLLPELDFDLVYDILDSKQKTELEIIEQRQRIDALKVQLETLKSSEAKRLLNISDNLVKQSVWIVGGDGWAYDIGYGGLDHVIATGKNVNILVLDNEVYSNTGGQMSKATPFGASTKFAALGKNKQKKDLGLLAMTYDNVYVASVAIGANQEQTLKAFNEAESYDGPSIIIAYAYSPSHGIDMKNPSQYHKAAVNSGQWLLYRHDPRRVENRLNPLQLDSEVPSIQIQEYLDMEKRFNKLFNNDNESVRLLIRQLQKQVDKRFDKYLSMASSNVPHRAKLLQNNKMYKSLRSQNIG